MREAWNKFVASHPLGTIHQTSFWGDFQAKNSDRDKYFIVTLPTSPSSTPVPISAGGLFIRQRLPLGLSWFYCPRGPLCNYSNPKELEKILEKLRPIAIQERAVFLRIDPPIEVSDADRRLTPKIPPGFRTAHAQYQPTHTLLLDLSLTEEQILAQMKPKGRYNIKIAQKHGVKIRPAAPPSSKFFKKDLTAFYKLLAATAKRDKFKIHPKSYYENMLKILGPKNMAELFIAEYTPHDNSRAAKNRAPKIIGGIIVTFFARTATYYFGASDYNYRNLMAPYLLQWSAIRTARQRGYKFYDFLGIAPLSQSDAARNSFAPQSSHPYSRITDFKLKFGGRVVNYIRAKEFIFKPIWYFLIKLAKKLK